MQVEEEEGKRREMKNEIKAKLVIKFKADREQCQGLMALRAKPLGAVAVVVVAAVTSLLFAGLLGTESGQCDQAKGTKPLDACLTIQIYALSVGGRTGRQTKIAIANNSGGDKNNNNNSSNTNSKYNNHNNNNNSLGSRFSQIQFYALCRFVIWFLVQV